MERSGQAADVVTPHLEDLRQLVERPGPFLTLVVERPESSGRSADRTASDVRSACEGGPFEVHAETVVAAVEEAFPEAEAVVVVVDQAGVVLIEHLDGAPRRAGAWSGEVPVLTSIIERRTADLPVVMVSVDRTGADVSWSGPLPAGAAALGGAEVDGPEVHLRKVKGGGWSHRRFQQRAEDAWERTAREVAAVVEAAADEVGARLLVVGGDDRMVHLVRAELPGPLEQRVREVPGSRADDGSDDDRDAAAVRWQRTAVAEDTVRALALFDRELGQADRAADGFDGVLGALRESRVDLLLVHDGEDGRSACFVPDGPTLVAGTARELEDLGAHDVRSARAIDVAIRAALLTGADVRIVPTTPKLTEGIGAVLRW